MQVRTHAASGVLVGAASLALGIGAAPAHALCDSYSGGCASTPPNNGGGGTDIGGTDQNPGSSDSSTTNSRATLPITGGEIVLLTALGAGALVGGTALVVAGRRKSSPAA